MGFAHRAFVAAGVGFAASAIVGCGSSGGSWLSASQSNNLNAQLNRVEQALQSGNCAQAQQYLSDFQSTVDNLGGVNSTLISDLDQGASTIQTLASRDCRTVVTTPKKTHPKTTTDTTTTGTNSTPTFTTPSTTQTYTTTTYTQPTDTNTGTSTYPTVTSTDTTPSTTTPSGGGGLGGGSGTTTGSGTTPGGGTTTGSDTSTTGGGSGGGGF